MSLFLSGRTIEYTNQVVFETDILRSNLYKMVGDSKLAETILASGLSTPILVSGTPCVPISPPGLSVTVGTGTIYAFSSLDETAYGVLPSDTNPNHVLFKQGINFDPIDLPTPAPAVIGNSVIHLVQAIFQEEDKNLVSRPYFNPSSTPIAPLPPIFEDNFDTRASLMGISLKEGIEGISPSPPVPDAGWTGLYYIAVTHGQTSIISGNITEVPGAPFIKEGLTLKISKASADTFYRPLKSLCAKVTYDTNTVQTINTIGNTKATYDKVIFDEESWWDDINHRFRPTIAGKYRLSVYGVIFDVTDPPIKVPMAFAGTVPFLNRVFSESLTATDPSGGSFVGTTIVPFNGTTDYVEYFFGIDGIQTYKTGAIAPGFGDLDNGFMIEYLGS